MREPKRDERVDRDGNRTGLGGERRIALRCDGNLMQTLSALSQMPQPVDLWLHPCRRSLRAFLEGHPNVRRVLFSPVKDTRELNDAECHSRLPVYGPYDDVLDSSQGSLSGLTGLMIDQRQQSRIL